MKVRTRSLAGLLPVMPALAALLLCSSPCLGTTLFALVDTGELFASGDQGATWAVQATLPVSDAVGLIAGSSTLELYLTATTGTVYRSTDAGLSWSAVGSVPASDVVDLSGRPDGALLVLTGSGSVWVSADHGASFSAEGVLPASNLVSLTVGAGGDLYALTGTGEVSESTDAGVTWTPVGTMPVPDAVEIRRLDTDLIVLTGTGLTYRSMDKGATWQAVGTVSQVGMTGLAPFVNELMAVSREGLVARSGDGATWSWVGTVNQLNVTALANDIPTATGVPETPVLPVRLTLSPPWPNPLRSSSGVLHVAFTLRGRDTVRLALFDIRGRPVAEREPEVFAGQDVHSVTWRPDGLVPGIYFLRLATRQGDQAGARVTVLR